jgi:hypothetical protein
MFHQLRLISFCDLLCQNFALCPESKITDLQFWPSSHLRKHNANLFGHVSLGSLSWQFVALGGQIKGVIQAYFTTVDELFDQPRAPTRSLLK